MEIASNEQSAEALRDALLAEAGRVQQLCGSPCAPGGTVPGDAERVSAYGQLASLLRCGAAAFEQEARGLTSIARAFGETDSAAGASIGR